MPALHLQYNIQRKIRSDKLLKIQEGTNLKYPAYDYI
jgi:hypothetical protein